MKKLILSILSLVMALCLCACVGSSAPGTWEPGENEQTKPSHGDSAPQDTDPAPEAMKTIYLVLTETNIQYLDGQEVNRYGTVNTYDENGLLQRREVTYSEGSTTVYTPILDQYGRVDKLEAVSNGISVVNEFTYDEAGNLLSKVVLADGVESYSYHYTYDEAGNRLTVESVFSDGSSEKYLYTYENGLLTKTEILSNGEYRQHTLYQYGEDGRLTAKTIYTGEAVWATGTYTYSEDGRTSYCDIEKYKLQTVETVDENGNVIRTESIDAGGSSVVEYTYLAIEIPESTPRKNG